MAALKLKGDRAGLEVARDLIRRGYRIAIPYGEDWDFDLIFSRPGSSALERVQVKYAESKGDFISVRRCSLSLTNGKVKRIKKDTAAMIDWLAVYDVVTDRCYYVHAAELGAGKRELILRLNPPRNGQIVGIRYAVDHLDLEPPKQSELEMEPAGFEPATSSVQGKRSPN
jgi:hypothetical protein